MQKRYILYPYHAIKNVPQLPLGNWGIYLSY